MTRPAPAAALAFLLLIVPLVNCRSANPQTEFRRDFRSKLERLETELARYRPGTHKQPGVVEGPNSKRSVELQMPNSAVVVEAAEAVLKHLDNVPAGVARQGLNGFDEWAAGLKNDLEQMRPPIDKHLDRIRDDVQANPGAYDTPIGVGAVSIASLAGPEVVVRGGDPMFAVFTSTGQFINVRRMIAKLDLDPWIDRMRRRAELEKRLSGNR